MFRSPLPWAVMVTEAALVYLLAHAWFGGADGRAPLAPLVAVSLTPLGYLVARLGLGLPHTGWWPWLTGALCCLGLNMLALTPQQGLGPAEAVAWRLGQALFPALIGLGLWWRGRLMAEEEDLAEHAQREFTLIGGTLVLVLGLYGHLVPTDPVVRSASVLLYLVGGLLAVGVARQQRAGSPASLSSVALVAACALGLLGVAAAFIALLRPEVLEAAASVLRATILLLVQLLLLPLVLLFEWLHLEIPAMPTETGGTGPARIDVPERGELPEWVRWLLGVLMLLGAIATAVVMLAALAYLTWEVWQRLARRFGARGQAPVAVEADGGLLHDTAAALAALRAWLARLAGRSADVPIESGAVRSVRAAYRALLRWARKRGLERDPWETPAEFRARLVDVVPDAAEPAALVTAAYEAMRYGDVTPPEQELERLQACVEQLTALPAA
jgi:hypothetical protein